MAYSRKEYVSSLTLQTFKLIVKALITKSNRMESQWMSDFDKSEKNENEPEMQWKVEKAGGAPGAPGTQDMVLLSMASVPDTVPGNGHTRSTKQKISARTELRDSPVGEDSQWKKRDSWVI